MKKNFTIYLIGICGISMSGIASLLYNLNFDVIGSDINFNDRCTCLNRNIKVNKHHNENNIKKDYIVIYNSAIDITNPELNYALNNNVVFTRAELLGEILKYFNFSIGVCGSHGKTTTSCMIANQIYNMGIYANIGGEDKNLSNFVFTGNKVFLSEVCEYKRNINYFKNDIAVALNLDLDHLECYKNLEDLKLTVFNYLDRAKYKVVNKDDNCLSEYYSKNLITYGIKNKATYNAKRIKAKNGKIKFNLYCKGEFACKVSFNSFCKHDVYNALATISVLSILEKTNSNLNLNLNFNGVMRRCELISSKDKLFYCDYAHHPKEILSTVNSFKKVYGNKILYVFQPHTFSRTKFLFKDFIRVLKNLKAIIYKTYPAREVESDGVSALVLAKELKTKYISSEDELKNEIKNSRKKVILFLGAGDIYYIAKKLFK